MKIADMIVPTDYVDKGGWVNLEKWTGRSLSNISLKFRDCEDCLMHISSLSGYVGDLNCDPRSGGIAGDAHLCQYYGVGPQQFARYIAPNLLFLRRLGNIRISNVSSVWASGRRYQDSVNERRRENLVQYTARKRRHRQD